MRIFDAFSIMTILCLLAATGTAQTVAQNAPSQGAPAAPITPAGLVSAGLAPAGLVSSGLVPSGLVGPSLQTVRQVLGTVKLDKWKRGTVREEANSNIGKIQSDLETNLPPLLQAADSAPDTVSQVMPVSRNIDALYDVLLRVEEAARVAAPDEQVGQLQQALLSLGNARMALYDRLQGSAVALEQQVNTLRGALKTQAANQCPAAPPPQTPTCAPPVHKKVVKKHAAPANSTQKNPSAGTAAAPH
jgi:hypothetical protein